MQIPFFTEDQDENACKWFFHSYLFVIITSCRKEKIQSNQQSAELSIFVKITVEVTDGLWYTIDMYITLRSIS